MKSTESSLGTSYRAVKAAQIELVVRRHDGRRHLTFIGTSLLGFRTVRPAWSREVARWFRRRHVLYPGFPCVAQGRTPCAVSTSRSSNRTCGFPASGSRTRTHAVAHGRRRLVATNRTKPSWSCRYSLGKRAYSRVRTLCFKHSHRRSLRRTCFCTTS